MKKAREKRLARVGFKNEEKRKKERKQSKKI